MGLMAGLDGVSRCAMQPQWGGDRTRLLELELANTQAHIISLI
jgi:hypothetical protein